jgi:maltodextrin utilization protein YvdJ
VFVLTQQESEALNIEYEKLVTELESTKEYQAEQAAIVQQWKDENLPLNKYVLLG